ncbi:MAG: hypothetical protein JKY09_02595 [Crocinitomicaceae bacterium]|nr:hypothetical protein [Crocinitomicaceae bacterium]
MVVGASVTGLFKMLLIIVGVLVLLRFVGQLMNAKRNIEEERESNARQRKFKEEKERKSRNLGKTKVLKKNNRDQNQAEDVDFEEIE